MSLSTGWKVRLTVSEREGEGEGEGEEGLGVLLRSLIVKGGFFVKGYLLSYPSFFMSSSISRLEF
jgi:hypothetical protein